MCRCRVIWRSAGRSSTVRIAENSVTGSAEDQVALGQTQRGDLHYRGNWWGTADPEAIAAGIFDRARDASLGRVLWEPPLPAPPGGCPSP